MSFGASENLLMSKPLNTTTKRIFVAATRMNEGKTTTCLGLFEALRSIFPRVGFIKPVGQRVVDVQGHKIDEDTFLLDSIYNVQVPIEAMSPIAVDGQFTRRYLDNPSQCHPVLVDKICRAFDRSAYEKDIIIIEGTGHAGVGAVFDLSNAQVAKLLDAKVIIVSEGGIGRPVDEIALNKALFDQCGVEVLGAILNKVQADKIESIRTYAEKALRRIDVPLLGVIPINKCLTAPNLSQVVNEIGGRWMNAEREGSRERVLQTVIGAMTARSVADVLEPGVLIITPGDREDLIFAALASVGVFGKKVVAGIILTNNVTPHAQLMEMIKRTSIPLVISHEESYAIASRIYNMTIKTQPQDTDKFPIIKRLIFENVQLGRILAGL